MTGQQRRDGVDRARLVAVHEDALTFYLTAVARSWVPAHLKDRKLTAALEPGSGWHVGYAPRAWTGLVEHLRELGYRDSTLEQSGLAQRARTGQLIDRFRDRLMLPIRDQVGDLVAFIGRAHPTAGPRVPRYLNSPTTPVYSKGDVLLGLAEQRHRIRAGATPVLVEGPLDAVAVTCAEPSAAGLAMCGTALTPVHASALAAQVPPGARVVVATDADAAGRTSARHAFVELTRASLTAWGAQLPSGLDPADVSRRLGPDHLAAALGPQARPLIDVIVEDRLAAWSTRLQWAEGMVGAARDAAKYIAMLPAGQQPRSLMSVAARTKLPCAEVALLVMDELAEQPDHQEQLPECKQDGLPPSSASRVTRRQDTIPPEQGHGPKPVPATRCEPLGKGFRR